MGKHEGKRPLGRENDIEMDLRDVVCDPGEWIDLTEDKD